MVLNLKDVLVKFLALDLISASRTTAARTVIENRVLAVTLYSSQLRRSRRVMSGQGSIRVLYGVVSRLGM